MQRVACSICLIINCTWFAVCVVTTCAKLCAPRTRDGMERWLEGRMLGSEPTKNCIELFWKEMELEGRNKSFT